MISLCNNFTSRGHTHPKKKKYCSTSGCESFFKKNHLFLHTIYSIFIYFKKKICCWVCVTYIFTHTQTKTLKKKKFRKIRTEMKPDTPLHFITHTHSKEKKLVNFWQKKRNSFFFLGYETTFYWNYIWVIDPFAHLYIEKEKEKRIKKDCNFFHFCWE